MRYLRCDMRFTMDWIPYVWSIFFTFVSLLILTDARCKFPKEWKGKWYQGRLGEVIIRSNNISPKGNCIERNDNGFYLVEDRGRKCYRCLLVMMRHENILEYKESHCFPKDSLDVICSNIQVETPLYTLVRDPHVDAICPFRDAFYFDYNDNMYGFCSTGMSYAKPCAGQSKFKFHFQHCVDFAYLHGQDMDFDCVATWKDGSDHYLYGKFSGPSVLTKDDGYRCFTYQMYGNEVKMAMSADTTCRGLRSPRDGPLIMEFTRDVHGWPQASCEFPEWLTTHESWRDLESRHIYDVAHDRSGTITITYRRRPDTKGRIKYELRCSDVLDQHSSRKKMKFISFTSHNCVAKHQCILLEEIVPNYIKVSLGSLGSEDDARRCRNSDIEETHYLVPGPSGGVPCPYHGRHRVQYATTDCPVDLLIGCNGTDSIDASCNNGQGLGDLQCLASMPQGGTSTDILVRDINNAELPTGCVSLTERGSSVSITTVCNRDVPNHFPQDFAITIQREPEDCRDEVITIPAVIDLPGNPATEESPSIQETQGTNYDDNHDSYGKDNSDENEVDEAGWDVHEGDDYDYPYEYDDDYDWHENDDATEVHTHDTQTDHMDSTYEDTLDPFLLDTEASIEHRLDTLLGGVSEVDLANTHGSQYLHIGQSDRQRPGRDHTTPSIPLEQSHAHCVIHSIHLITGLCLLLFLLLR